MARVKPVIWFKYQLNSNKLISIKGKIMENNDKTTSELREKANLLKKRLELSISNVGRKKIRNQHKATLIKLLTLLCSGSATILLGLNVTGLESLFNNTDSA